MFIKIKYNDAGEEWDDFWDRKEVLLEEYLNCFV